MTDEIFTDKLRELSDKMRDLSPEQREALQPLLEETKDRHAVLQENISRANDALDDWRLNLKYALFDRDARRREGRQ